MHRTIRTGLILGSFVAVVGVGHAQAQITDPIDFTTPFAFSVDGHQMPAGRYEIRPVNEQSTVMELNNRQARRGMFFEVESLEHRSGAPADQSVVTFLHEGSTYVLRDVWVAGESIGAEAVGKLPEAMRAAVDSGRTSEVQVAAVVTGHASHAARS